MVTLECSFQFYLYSFATSKQSEMCVKMCNLLIFGVQLSCETKSKTNTETTKIQLYTEHRL